MIIQNDVIVPVDKFILELRMPQLLLLYNQNHKIEISKDCFKLLLEYIYTDKLQFYQKRLEDIFPLLSYAEILNEDRLIYLIKSYFKRAISRDNALKFYQLSQQYQLKTI